MSKLKEDKTERGFSLVEFKDDYGIQCSLQKSSLATKDAIWLGVDDVNAQIMDDGWKPFVLPDNVLLHNRMHLTRKQVAELLPLLQRFVATGELTKKR